MSALVNFFPFGLFGFPFSELSPPKLYGSLLFDTGGATAIGGATATGFLFSGGGFLFIAERERGGVGKRERGVGKREREGGKREGGR